MPGVLTVVLLTAMLALALASAGSALGAWMALVTGVVVCTSVIAWGHRPRRSRRRRHWTRRVPYPGQQTAHSTAISLFCDVNGNPVGGRVRIGPWRGKRLDTLTLDTLLEIGAAIPDDDGASLALFARYLDATHPTWQDADAEDRGAARNRRTDRRSQTESARRQLDRADALRILGLAEGASPEDICAAHKRLIMRVHPDVGGSAALTAEVNAAKASLL
jgi:hypothetical protein